MAAIRAAQLGAQVTLVEKDTLGGTCLNRGCSGGLLWPLFDQITETGVDSIHPIDPEAGMDMGEEKAHKARAGKIRKEPVQGEDNKGKVEGYKGAGFL